MARRKAAPKRQILPDPLFQSELLAEFVNVVMQDGKKSLAEKIVYGALGQVVEAFQNNKASFSEVHDEDGEAHGDGAANLKPVKGDIRDSEQVREFALDVFKRALKNISPAVEVKSRRVGGSTYQVPVEVRPRRRKALGMRWLAAFARKRSEKSMTQRLANEIIDALAGRGGAVRQRQEVHRMAKSNQAFAHFRW